VQGELDEAAWLQVEPILLGLNGGGNPFEVGVPCDLGVPCELGVPCDLDKPANLAIEVRHAGETVLTYALWRTLCIRCNLALLVLHMCSVIWQS